MRRIGVVGGGRFGKTLASSLASAGIEVVLIDDHRETVEEVASSLAKAVIGDATQTDALLEAGMGDCDTVVVTISENVEASILATMALKEIKVPHVVARAFSEIHGRVLTKIGADRVVNPARDMALRLAKSLAVASLRDYIEVAEGISILEVNAAPEWHGRTLAETGMRNQYGVMVLAINRRRGDSGKVKTVTAPAGDDRILEGDTLIVFGPDDKLRNFEKRALPTSGSEPAATSEA